MVQDPPLSPRTSPPTRFEKAVAIVVVTGTALHCLCALYFLVADYNVISDCNLSGRVVWPTTLWHYVLLSALAGPAVAFTLYSAPLHRTFEAVQMLAAARNFPELLEDSTPRKFGIQPSMPDWLLMCCGAWLVGVGCFLEILAYWGYCELFLTRAMCSDIHVVYEEISLWGFGKFTWVLQVFMGGLFVLFGASCWGSPVLLEVRFPSATGRLPSGAPHSPPTPPSPPGGERYTPVQSYGATQRQLPPPGGQRSPPADWDPEARGAPTPRGARA